MSRFPPIAQSPGGRFANLAERLDEPLPDESTLSRSSVSERLAAMRARADDQAKRLPAFRTPTPAARASASAPASPGATVPAAPTITPAQAAHNAAQAARERHAAVMASGAAKGREKQASDLLMASCGRNAEHTTSTAIIAKLSTCPTDAQLAAVDTHFKKVAAAKVWDKAQATLDRDRGAKSGDASKGNTDVAIVGSVWDRAWAKVSADRGTPLPADAATQKVTKADSVWDRAYAKMERAKA